jgi:O-methyltransferase
MHFTKELRLFQPPGSGIRKVAGLINLAMIRFGWRVSLEPAMNHASIMVSPLQKLNFMHLIDSVLFNKVPGAFVELGCFEGQTATFLQLILNNNRSDKQLFLYDNFKHQLAAEGDIKTRLKNNFKNKNLQAPLLIDGDFENTIPSKLPDEIAFLHIDCGFGGDHEAHKKVILHCLESCYPRMKPGAVAILSDYHDKDLTVDGFNSNPGVKMATDIFFKDKPEEMYVLYGGEYSHGYFRKAIS